MEKPPGGIHLGSKGAGIQITFWREAYGAVSGPTGATGPRLARPFVAGRIGFISATTGGG